MIIDINDHSLISIKWTLWELDSEHAITKIMEYRSAKVQIISKYRVKSVQNEREIYEIFKNL